MKKVDRRQFLKGSAAALGALGLPAFWLPPSARAAGPGPKKLVLLFLGGGNDSMNMIVPTTTYATAANGGGVIPDGGGTHPLSQYDYYKQLRPTIHLKKTEDGPGPHLMPLGDFDLDHPGKHRLSVSDQPEAAVSSPTHGVAPIGSVEFSFHPAFASLMPIWDAGHMAIFPSTHCGPNANRSHFFQTEYLGHGLNTTHSDQMGDGKGWVGRYFEDKYGSPSVDGIEGFDFESGYYPLMDGDIPVIGMSNPEYADLGDDGHSIKENTLTINALRETTASTAYNKYAAVQESLFSRVAKLDAVDYSDPGYPGDPETPLYPTHSIGRSFRQAAALIKDPVVGAEIEILNLDRGGFDTHGNQVSESNSAEGSHADRLQECAEAIKAFYDDMAQAGCGEDVMVLVQTEFGRTADENDNFGTDHARAACWFAVGGENTAGDSKNINGGMYGAWPGIAHGVEEPSSMPVTYLEDLDGSSRFYLHQTTDYRDILSEIIGDFLDNNGVDGSAPFNPGFTNDYTRTSQGFVDTT